MAKGKDKVLEKGNSEGSPKESLIQDLHTISNSQELNSFLQIVKDKLTEDQGAPVHAVSAMNYVMNLSGVDSMLNAENKELARDIWLRIKQSGFQLRTPPMLFGEDEDIAPDGL